MRRILPLALTLAALAGAVVPLATRAQDRDSMEAALKREQARKEYEENQKKLADIRRQAQENRDRAQRLRGRETQAVGELRRTERDLNMTRRRLRGLQQRRSSLDRQLGQTHAHLERTQATLKERKDRLRERLRRMYVLGGEGRELEFLLSTRSFAQLLARWDFLVMVAEQDRLLLEDVQHHSEEVTATMHHLETNQAEIARNQKETESENDKLDRLRRERASSVQYIRTQRKAYDAAAAELERTARDLQALLARLERQRRAEEQRARTEGRAPEPYTGDFAKGRGALDWPVRGQVVGRFGPEKHPRFGTVTLNQGIDIEAAVGTTVRGVAKGRVDYVNEDFSSYGQVVIVNHGDGYYTLYGHLSDIAVRVGQEVQSGEVIGRSGESGTSLKGPVLHFEVRKGGTALDPADWLR